ncbi:hypothetical protein [Nitrospirillum viridazoti]|uniref:Fucose-binding lectin II (PA-IIL) n=1 Tax=Nitrospirillum amazonense TaxID=28077 RepID=A0A560I1H5_9PROT|nr:hypothetical protein [Nitrospirillum amazonense]TWB52776.1 hypothetical protein FBZ92_11721 [Nitrospirillum amazonense]
MYNTATFPVPDGTTIKINGFTNSAYWAQRIVIEVTGQAPITWNGTGAQNNKLVGQAVIPPGNGRQVSITMSYDPGGGFAPSTVVKIPFDDPSLTGFVIGGQDAGGRPNGPASWNTVAFVYWAKGY